MPPTADMENKIDSGCHLQKNVIVKQYILDHAVRSPSLTFKKRMALFFCRVRCHRELLKKTNINFCILSYWVQSKWQTLFLPFLSLPFNLLSIKPKVTLSSTLCVCGERGGVSITSNFINCKKKKKKLIITSTVHSPNFTSIICSSPTPFIISQTKYQNRFCYSPKYTSKPTSPCGLDAFSNVQCVIKVGLCFQRGCLSAVDEQDLHGMSQTQ